VVLIAQTTRTPLSLGDVLPVLGVSLITSEGARTARALDCDPGRDAERSASIPAVGLVLALSVDRFIGMARAPGNLIGNCVAAWWWRPGGRSRLPHGEPVLRSISTSSQAAR
jgi:aerobic C4-dicarboxylate transport protein